MVGESNQNLFLIQIYASSFAKFEISEFEISRFDCIVPYANSLEPDETPSNSASHSDQSV